MSESIMATVGWSQQADAARAGQEAAEAALAKLSPFSPQMALVFASSWFDQETLIRSIRSTLGDTLLVGESTAGEITPEGPMSHSCVIMLIASSILHWSVGLGEGLDHAPRAAGQQAAYAAMKEFQGARIGLLLFSDGLVSSYADVVRGAQEVLGTSSLIAGGMAGDDWRMNRTYQYCNNRVVSHAVVGALLGGQGKMGVGIEHGFAPISKPRHVTRARANVLIELDHQPAASVYEEYFGEELVRQLRAQELTRQGLAYPLGVQCETDNQWLLRNVVAFEADGSLSCSGELPEGAWVQLMLGSTERALEAAGQAARQAVQSLDHVACVIVFDSALRRKLLGPQRAALEFAEIRRAVGASVPLVGCYTYGEQAPLGMNLVHGRTAVQTGSVLAVALGT